MTDQAFYPVWENFRFARDRAERMRCGRKLISLLEEGRGPPWAYTNELLEDLQRLEKQGWPKPVKQAPRIS